MIAFLNFKNISFSLFMVTLLLLTGCNLSESPSEPVTIKKLPESPSNRLLKTCDPIDEIKTRDRLKTEKESKNTLQNKKNKKTSM